MNLYVNIGNSNVWFSYGRDHDIVYSVKVSIAESSYQAGIDLAYIKQVKHVGIASVVSAKTLQVKTLIAKYTDAPIKIFTATMSPLLKDSPYDMTQLGVDRMLAVHGAMILEKAAFVLCDCGTASTINVVNADGQFIGGMIFPGLGLSNQALAQGTSALQVVSLQGCVSDTATHTEANIRSGIILSTVYTVERVAQEHQCRIILTGGNAKYVAPYFQSKVQIEPNLIMEGMQDLL